MVVLTAWQPLCAEDSPRWNVSGFGTLATLATDTDQLGFIRDRSQLESTYSNWGISNDSRLGLQLDLAFNDQWNATVQWIARDHAGDFFEQNLEWAFIRWSPSTDINIRAGRLGADLFLLSDYRNVGYAYPWIRPPHEFYANLPVYHFDGLDVAKKFTINEGDLTIKIFGGHSFNQITASPIGSVGVSSPAIGMNMVYEKDNWRLRAGYGYLRLLSDSEAINSLMVALQEPSVNQLIPGIYPVGRGARMSNTDVHFASIGAAYDDGVWQVQAEGSYTDAETYAFPDTASGYFHVGRRFDKLTVYSLLGISQTYQKNISVADPLLPMPALAVLKQAVESFNTTGIDEKSISLGLRWDVVENVAIKSQWSHYWLGTNGNQLWDESQLNSRGPSEVNVISFGVDFIF